MSDSAADPDEFLHLNHLLVVLPEPLSLIQVLFANAQGAARGASQKMKVQYWGRVKVLQSRTPVDAALTVAHAVWYFAGVP